MATSGRRFREVRWGAVRKGGSLLAVLLLVVAGLTLRAEEPLKESPIEKEREQRLSAMQRRLDAIDVRLTAEEKSVEQKRREKPLMRFSDSARTFFDGGVWAFGERGRPSLLVTLEKYEQFWTWELTSLATEPLSAEFPDEWTWSPKAPGVAFQVIPNAGAPADNDAGRLRQMKTLVRRISASETTGTGERFELRLMPQPILRYSVTGQALGDGALFAFAHGTNPEVLAVIEVRSSKEGTPAWNYGVVPMTTAAAAAKLDDREVWTKPLSMLPKQHEPYTYFGDPAVFTQKD